ncbi:MAG TPA: hypothetical protein EYN67_20945 [Flavobacteriales bacterium]|nr:hypothetical protein [Flavobacteriales bacterium]HHZ97949.1 hypothetical protein [Flavobacteriales bacterium]
MPGLVLTGDLTDYLGKYFPNPFIDTVNVYENSLKVKVSLYLRAPDNDITAAETLDSLDPLKVYISMVIGKQQIQDLINGKKDPFWSIVDKAVSWPQFPGIDCCDGKCKGSLMKEYQKLWDANSVTDSSFRDVNASFTSYNIDRHSMDPILWKTLNNEELPFSHTLLLNELTWVDTLLDENSNKIFKYSTVNSLGAPTIEFNFPHDIAELFGDTPADYTPASGLDFESSYGTPATSYITSTRDTSLEDQYPPERLCKDYQDLAIFAWTSPYEASDQSSAYSPYRYDGSNNELPYVGDGYGMLMTGYQWRPNYDQSLATMRSHALNAGWDVTYLPGTVNAYSTVNLTPNNQTLSTVGCSNMAYTKVIENGTLASGTQVIYVDSNNLPYNEGVLQSLNGKYYKAVKVTHLDIVNNFEALVAEYAGTNLTPRMQELLDNISYILGVYGESVELLTQLNSLRVVIPEQGNATLMGKLFNKITTRIANFDSGLGRENILFRKLGANHTVYERRTLESSAWDIADYGVIGEAWQNFIAAGIYGQGDVTRIAEALAFFTGGKTTERVDVRGVYKELLLDYDPSDYLYPGMIDSKWFWQQSATASKPFVNSGYIFFDFEKYLYQQTRLSQVLDISKLIYWFGQEFVNMTVAPYSLAFERYKFIQRAEDIPGLQGNGDTTEYWEEWIHDSRGEADAGGGISALGPISMGGAVAYFLKEGLDVSDDAVFYDDEYDYPDSRYPMQTFPVSIGTTGVDGEGGTVTQDEAVTQASGEPATDTDTQYTYIVPHSFNVANPEGLGDYQLMCFEWQDVSEDHPGNYDYYQSENQVSQAAAGGPTGGFFYKITLKVFDRSKMLVDQLVETYTGAQAALIEYKELAEQLCSYNNITNEFNQFFINGAIEHYGDDLANAPWNRVPLVYLMHRDLLENTFDGSVDEIVSAARVISAQIGPEYGALENLLAFKTEVDTFYSQNYSAPGPGATENAAMVTQYWAGAVVSDSAYGGNFMYHVDQWDKGNELGNLSRDFGSVDTLTIYRMVDSPIFFPFDRASTEAEDAEDAEQAEDIADDDSSTGSDDSSQDEFGGEGPPGA